QAAQVRRPLEEGLGRRQELLPLGRQWRAAARAAAFVVQRDAQTLFQGQETAAQSLFGKEEGLGGGAQASLPRQLNKGGHLVRGQRRNRCRGHKPSRNRYAMKTKEPLL